MTASGIPKHCTICGAELLNPHQLDGLCRECKLVPRNERLVADAASVRNKRGSVLPKPQGKLDN
jgi:hypothetical protein